MRFVDTNVLLYSVSPRPEEATKASIARALLAADDLAVSVQVLQEFYVQATRASLDEPLTHAEAVATIRVHADLPLQAMTYELLEAAITTTARYRISYWDAAIIEAARALGCETVLSEDLQHGQDFGGVRVENPFL